MSAPSRTEHYTEAIAGQDDTYGELQEMLAMVEAIDGRLEDWQSVKEVDIITGREIAKARGHITRLKDILAGLGGYFA